VAEVRAMALAELEEMRNHKPSILEGISLPDVLFFRLYLEASSRRYNIKEICALSPPLGISPPLFGGQR
jgi:hypothetical protein